MEIKGCVAVMTGGASGLGEACVRDLARLGATIRLDGALRMAAR